MKINKKKATMANHAVADAFARPCRALRVQNIVLPEQYHLDSQTFPSGKRAVIRIIDGKVLSTDDGRLAIREWEQSKLDYMLGSSVACSIGTHSSAAIIAMSRVLTSITDPAEQSVLADKFCGLDQDSLLITTEAEDHLCVEVTRELYEEGMFLCVDSWEKTDKWGKAKSTLLHVGDYLIFEDDGAMYCVRGDEFRKTYSIG